MYAHVSISGEQPVTAADPAAAAQAERPRTRGDAMVAELKWVHDMIRGDLRIVRQLAADAEAGRPAAELAAGIATLAAGGPLWQLRVNCLQYCQFVHHHHQAESVMLFPALRRANPALGPVVDRLEADHARVSGLLDDVTGAAHDLADDDSPAVRRQLSVALQVLSDVLLAHLAYEEENVADTMRGMPGWPGW
jgi:Hemerythrin HHE cation binding domain